MNDDHLEDLLRQVRPTGPPPGLRARITAPRRVQRVWPWALAAAAMLFISVALHASATVAAARAVGDRVEQTEAAIASLTEMLGGGADARATSELIVASEQMSARRNAPAGADARTALQ